jgi:hypothetical protein
MQFGLATAMQARQHMKSSRLHDQQDKYGMCSLHPLEQMMQC